MKSKENYGIDREKFLDREQRKILLNTCKDKAELDLLHGRRNWVVRFMLVDLALFTGLRVSEIAGLKLSDLNLKNQAPYIVVRSGKGNKKRTVYLEPGLVKHLKDFIQLKQKTWDQSIEPEAPLFPNSKGDHSKPLTFMKSFKVAIMEAGLPEHYSIHCCRHTYGVFLLHDTKNLRYVQKQLGHSNIGMTALYADILPEENGKLANLISRD